ncbi:Rho/RAC guanine nucleotide exchange factor, putative [Entamoeba invadens IP1]|uniref:Rho/RAC guanine nucleotide exchange factor, putative n=1 Tax=Entamoeba invadens IP1 TaxID=370355 RepID=A0A0A1TVP9_ENTIV|nr:Rho/RAC guanine nucleotide exchange factor, putative [Entamoeba invadens IP1]ELP84564.1 Rho/RAC guanine nucleotide exchange factor, putative [Entamoeba invadens IP1]|eukprot:XP_004183910.1 Rho/RAC guanine nucleotide exchange factor, putative [Entamoeba invadens IP1]
MNTEPTLQQQVPNFLLPTASLDPKAQLLISTIAGQIMNPETRENGLAFISKSIDNPSFAYVLLQVNPQLYTQFLSSEDPMSLSFALFIITKLSKNKLFTALFIQHDPTLLTSLKNLVASQTQNIFKQTVEVLYALITQINDKSFFAEFIPPLITKASLDKEMRLLCSMLLLNIIGNKKNSEIFIENGGLQMEKDVLESCEPQEIKIFLEILIMFHTVDPEKNRDMLITEGFFKTFTFLFEKITDKAQSERLLLFVSQFPTSPLFATNCIESGLFDEILRFLDFVPDNLQGKNLQQTLIIVFRMTQDVVGVQKCSSLKLIIKLDVLLRNIAQMPENIQIMVLGTLTNLLKNQQAVKEMMMYKIYVNIKNTPPAVLKNKAIILWKALMKHFDEVAEILAVVDYTQDDMQKIAEYNSKKAKAAAIVDELIQTEKSYVKQLDICTRVVMKKLENSLQEKKEQIFGNIPQIWGFQFTFAKELEDTLLVKEEEKQEYSVISHVLLKYFTPQMVDLYTKYSNIADDGMALFSSLSKTNKEVECAVRELSALGHHVSSYLILPIQRIPRYVMLIESLIKCMPEYLEESKHLKLCYEKIREIGKEVNDNKRKYESEMAIKKWSGRIDLSQFPNDERTFVFEMDQVLMSEKKDTIVCTMIIFSDIAVIARTVGRKEKWKIKHIMNLDDWKSVGVTDEKLSIFQQHSGVTVELSCSKINELEYLENQLKAATKQYKINKLHKQGAL